MQYTFFDLCDFYDLNDIKVYIYSIHIFINEPLFVAHNNSSIRCFPIFVPEIPMSSNDL